MVGRAMRSRELHFGLFLPQIGLVWPELEARVRNAEALGFHSVWLMDHLAAPGAEECISYGLAAFRLNGMLVGFGNASGAPEPFDPLRLARMGSLYLTRPTLMDYTAKREDLLSAARELFEVVSSGAVKVEINQTYPLAEAAQAHRDLEARRTMGSIVLLP